VIVMCQVADTPKNFCVPTCTGWEISDDAYRIHLGLSQISEISLSLSDVGYGRFKKLSGNS